MNRGREDEPTAVLEAALQQLAQNTQAQQQQQLRAAAAAAAPSAPAFVPAPRFQGAKPGYLFSTGHHGTGYYRDGQQALAEDEPSGRQQQDPQELLRQAEEQAEAAEVQLLDDKSLRKMLNQFEKKAKENLELRMKHTDEPMKFLDNEVDLMSIIRGLAQVAADPNSLYPLLIDSPAVATLAGLLSHDNTDIAMEVMDLLQELTDSDEEQDNQEVAGGLVDALLEANLLELLVERLTKLNEAVDEEATAVNNALAVIEHVLELRPALAEPLLARTKLLKWLLGRIRTKASDSNKQYASEVLSILMQGHEANQVLLNKANGIDTLLVCLAGFKSREPADAEEQEFMENVFDTLCSCLLLPANRAAFVECEGVELMHLLLKGKKSSRAGAIKAIDFATTRSPPACDRLVEAGALAQLFGVFMGRSKVKNSKGEADKEAARELEQRCVSIISNLFQGVSKNSRKERLAAKFVEAEFEKVDRLMEVAFRYEASVAACEARLAAEAAQLQEEVDEQELLLERLDAGLFTLQCCLVVVAALWSTGDAGLRRRLLACLHQRGESLEIVRSYLREYYFGLGDDGALEEKQRQLQRLGQLLSALGVDIAAEAADRQQQQAAAAGEAAAADDGDEAAAAAAGQAAVEDVAMGEGDDAAAAAAGSAADAADADASQQQQQQHGNGADQQQQQEQPLDEQAQPQAAQEQRSTKPQEQKADRQKERERGRDRESSREEQREPAGRGRDDRDRDGRRDSRGDRERDRDRDRARESDSKRSSRRKSRSRSKSRSRDGHRSSKHKRIRRHSRSRSRS